ASASASVADDPHAASRHKERMSNVRFGPRELDAPACAAMTPSPGRISVVMMSLPEGGLGRFVGKGRCGHSRLFHRAALRYDGASAKAPPGFTRARQIRRWRNILTGERSCLAIVLAAGEGTRMRSARPKVLHAIGGRSLVGHVLDAVRGAGCTAAAVVI